jgi:hypothetical protein
MVLETVATVADSEHAESSICICRIPPLRNRVHTDYSEDIHHVYDKVRTREHILILVRLCL